MTRRFVPLHESVESTLRDALALPGMSHLKTKVLICEAEKKTSALIDFLAAGESIGVTLNVCADGSFILIEKRPGENPWSQSWMADEADPDVVTGAVIAALRRRVTDPVPA